MLLSLERWCPSFASVVPVVNLLDLWNVPVGSGIRPMLAPLALLFYGCGTPAVVLGLAIFRFLAECGSRHSVLRCRIVFRATLVVACLMSFVPTVLTTYGFYWVITTRHLRLEP